MYKLILWCVVFHKCTDFHFPSYHTYTSLTKLHLTVFTHHSACLIAHKDDFKVKVSSDRQAITSAARHMTSYLRTRTTQLTVVKTYENVITTEILSFIYNQIKNERFMKEESYISHKSVLPLYNNTMKRVIKIQGTTHILYCSQGIIWTIVANDRDLYRIQRVNASEQLNSSIIRGHQLRHEAKQSIQNPMHNMYYNRGLSNLILKCYSSRKETTCVLNQCGSEIFDCRSIRRHY